MLGQVATVALLTLSCEEEALYTFLNGSLFTSGILGVFLVPLTLKRLVIRGLSNNL